MKIVYTDAHVDYAPKTTVFDGERRPAREVPERMAIIKGVLERSRSNVFVEPRRHGEAAVARLHRREYIDFIKEISAATPPDRDSFPAVWPPMSPRAKPPAHPRIRMGYYISDMGTPVTRAAYDAALAAVDCALTGAGLLLEGERLAYALVRPPGHHAERARAAGLCFFNNTALAAHLLARRGRVATLDIDFHHGNGTQALFYRTDRVLTTSLHGAPEIAFPFYSGWAGECGAGRGRGYNLNVPLPKRTSTEEYRRGLAQALDAIRRFRPGYLVVALGFDTYEKDPNGGFLGITTESFQAIGRDIGSLGLPTLLVQEGGYNLEALGACAQGLFEGLAG